MICSLILLLIILFSGPLITLASLLSKCLSNLLCFCCYRESAEPELPPTSDDLYRELNFSQLFHEHHKLRVQYERVKGKKESGAFGEEEVKRYINKYLSILDRNLDAMFRRLNSLASDHIDRIGGLQEDPDSLTDEQRIKIVYDYFSQGIDKDNPLRGYLSIDEHMFGRMGTSLQSYDIMENPTYKDADQILVVMKETFGMQGHDLKELVRTELIERTLNLVKQ